MGDATVSSLEALPLEEFDMDERQPGTAGYGEYCAKTYTQKFAGKRMIPFHKRLQYTYAEYEAKNYANWAHGWNIRAPAACDVPTFRGTKSPEEVVDRVGC